MNRTTRVIGVVLGVLALAALLFAGGFFVGTVYWETRHKIVNAPSPLDKNFDVLGEVVDDIEHGYVESVPKKKLVKGSIDGVIKALDDPYTRVLNDTHFKALQEETAGKFGGVGMELGTKDHKLVVVAPIKGTPAEKAGVTAGDNILRIDETDTKGMPVGRAVKLIRGEPGTKVRLKMKRESGEVYSVTITRANIRLPNTSSKMFDGDLGYINVHQFSADTGKDVKKEVESLKKKGAKGIILDLRNNPGGLLNEAISLASVFIEDGSIVGVKSRNGKVKTLAATGGADTKIPLVVLVNKGSASASEIVTGAIQDRKRGLVVGETTYGKASVQTVITLSNGEGLVMTTAKYLTPKGRSLHKVGTKPDIVVKTPKGAHYMGKDDAQLNQAKATLKELISGKKID